MQICTKCQNIQKCTKCQNIQICTKVQHMHKHMQICTKSPNAKICTNMQICTKSPNSKICKYAGKAKIKYAKIRKIKIGLCCGLRMLPCVEIQSFRGVRTLNQNKIFKYMGIRSLLIKIKN